MQKEPKYKVGDILLYDGNFSFVRPIKGIIVEICIYENFRFRYKIYDIVSNETGLESCSYVDNSSRWRKLKDV